MLIPFVLIFHFAVHDPVHVRATAFLQDRKNCGLVVGIWHEGHTRVIGLGSVFLPGGERTPDGTTIFEIGSITKPLTGILLAEAVRKGEVKLDDPVAKHLPDELVPPTIGDPVTLLHLATHFSGLPVQPPLLGLAAKNPLNPYADCDQKKLINALRVIKPTHKPGEEYRYSNLGAGLVGHALVAAAGADSFDALLRERLCQPLNIKDTAEALTGEQRSRLARGHTAEGKPTPHWDFATLVACGGVRSTANDLLKFAAASFGEAKSDVLPAIQEAMLPRKKLSSSTSVGLFWMTTVPREEVKRIWHNGATYGHQAIIVLVPERKVAVVVLCSVSTRDLDRLGMDLASLVK